MTRISSIAGSGLFLAGFILFTVLPLSADDRTVATHADPAVIAIRPTPAGEVGLYLGEALPQTDATTYLSLEVMAYTPPRDGRVEAVVTVEGLPAGTNKEIGRFSIFPSEPFKARDLAEAQRFLFRMEGLSLESGPDYAPKVNVALVSAEGHRVEDARLEVGRALILNIPGLNDDRRLATADQPAILSILSDGGKIDGPASEATYVSVEVLGYTPPKTGGRVEAVVRILDPLTAERKEIGRFSIFPNEHYKSADRSEAQRFLFRVDDVELKTANRAKPKLLIDLVPAKGYGAADARLEFGTASLERH